MATSTYNFQRFAKDILKHSDGEKNKDMTMTKEVKGDFNSMVVRLLDRIMATVDTMMSASGRKTIEDNFVKSAVEAVTREVNNPSVISEVGRQAVEGGQQAVTSSHSESDGQAKRRSEKAGVHISIPDIEKMFRAKYSQYRLNKDAPVFLAGAVDSILSHIFAQAADITRASKASRLNSNYIVQSIQRTPVVKNLLEGLEFIQESQKVSEAQAAKKAEKPKKEKAPKAPKATKPKAEKTEKAEKPKKAPAEKKAEAPKVEAPKAETKKVESGKKAPAAKKAEASTSQSTPAPAPVAEKAGKKAPAKKKAEEAPAVVVPVVAPVVASTPTMSKGSKSPKKTK